MERLDSKGVFGTCVMINGIEKSLHSSGVMLHFVAYEY